MREKIIVCLWFYVIAIFQTITVFSSYDQKSLHFKEDQTKDLEKGSFFYRNNIYFLNKENGDHYVLKREGRKKNIYKNKKKVGQFIVNKKDKDKISFKLLYNNDNNKKVYAYKVDFLIEIKEGKNSPAKIEIKEISLKGVKEEPLFINIYPKYNSKKNRHYLDFPDRVSISSSRNILLVPFNRSDQLEHPEIVFMFGLSRYGYILDFDPKKIDEILAFALGYSLYQINDD